MSQSTHNSKSEVGSPDKLLSLVEVQRLMSLSRSTIYRMIEDSRFPRPLKIGHTSRWPSSEVDTFIENCKRERAPDPGAGKVAQWASKATRTRSQLVRPIVRLRGLHCSWRARGYRFFLAIGTKVPRHLAVIS